MSDRAALALSLPPLPALATEVVPLDPKALSEEVEAALHAVRRSATPEATWSAYFKGVRYFAAWHHLRLGRPLTFPVDVPVTCLFVIDHFGTPSRVATGPGAKLHVAFTMPAPVDQALVRSRLKIAPGRLRTATIEQRLSALAWAHREQDLEPSTEHPKAVGRLPQAFSRAGGRTSAKIRGDR